MVQNPTNTNEKDDMLLAMLVTYLALLSFGNVGLIHCEEWSLGLSKPADEDPDSL